MRRFGLVGFVVITLMLAAGCTGAGGPSDDAKIEKPDRTYSGLYGQVVAVMVWADWGTRTEYNQIQLDLARSIQIKLEERIKKLQGEQKGKEQGPAATRFVDSRSVVRYQREHPEIDGQPIQQVAPKFGVDRVIYVEIESFQAQSPQTIMLLKGRTSATLRVAEVTGGVDGIGRVAFEEMGIVAGFPPNAPEGVVASDRVTVETIYRGTVDALADRIVARFELGKK